MSPGWGWVREKVPSPRTRPSPRMGTNSNTKSNLRMGTSPRARSSPRRKSSPRIGSSQEWDQFLKENQVPKGDMGWNGIKSLTWIQVPEGDQTLE